MAEKNNVQVVIDGKVYMLSGYENEDYLNKVALYINNKIAALRQEENFRHQGKEVQSMLVYLNIADDYYKIKKQTDLLEIELEDKKKEIYDLKHELISLKMQQEETEQQLDELKKQVNDQEKNIVKLEAERGKSSET